MSTIAYRAGTHSSFLAAMRARLSAAEFAALDGLRTRDTTDPAIALLDAWAVVGDVLTFYQERIANEGYLRTATERRSVLELARLIGYAARPGVAAGVFLAYTVDKNAEPVTIPKGSRANSIPGPGEAMQAFETSEDVEARAEWSIIGIRRTRPQTPESIIANGLYLAGTATNLRPGDALLITYKPAPGLPVPVRVVTVEPDNEHQRTRVTLADWTPDAGTIQILRRELSRYREVERFGIARDGATAARTLDILDAFDQRVGDSATPAVIAAATGKALKALRTELAAARAGHYARLEPWLSGVIGVLARAQEFAVAAGPAQSPSRDSDGLGSLIATLRLPPSVPPRNSQNLARSVTSAFAGGSDVFPSLLAPGTPSLYSALASLPVTPASPLVVHAFRQAAPLFGHNAPREPQYEPWFEDDEEGPRLIAGIDINPHGGQPKPQPWAEWELLIQEADPTEGEDRKLAFLDNAYPQLLAETPAIVDRPPSADTRIHIPVVTAVASATVRSRAAYGLSAKTTAVVFKDKWWTPVTEDDVIPRDDFGVVRQTIVYCQSEQLELVEEPITGDVCGDEVELDGLYDGLRSGRWMIIAGERADVSTAGVRAAELVMVAGVRHGTSTVQQAGNEVPLPGDALHTFISFAKPLAFCYRRDSVVLHGNVVPATHGETRHEVLGGGDPAASLQTFALKLSPLTYVSARTVSGVASSLEVRVSEVRWHEAESLLGLDASARGFVTRIDNEQKTFVTFGDGIHGARPSTGFDNITATYRTGIGNSGNAKPNQISLLADKPLGVTGVVNPIRSSGGAEPESRDDIRRNAPLAVTALDRLVGIDDYADFARTFAGIGKAASVRLSAGGREVIHVTIAGASDAPIDPTSDVYANLRAALRRYGDPNLPIQVAVRELLVVALSASVRVRPDYRWETVEPELRSALLQAFGFDRRELGQDLVPSAVLAVMQAVPGVEYVDLDALTAIEEAELIAGIEADAQPLAFTSAVQTLRVLPARPGVDGQILPAQLAYLQAAVRDTLILNEVNA